MIIGEKNNRERERGKKKKQKVNIKQKIGEIFEDAKTFEYNDVSKRITE